LIRIEVSYFKRLYSLISQANLCRVRV